MSPLPTYPEIAASFLALAQPIADNDAAKPWDGQPGYAAASNSLTKTINAAVNNTQRLVTQET